MKQVINNGEISGLKIKLPIWNFRDFIRGNFRDLKMVELGNGMISESEHCYLSREFLSRMYQEKASAN